MLQLTIFYGPHGSGKTFNALRAKKSLQTTCIPYILEGVYHEHTFKMIDALQREEVIDILGKTLKTDDLHLIITTTQPPRFFMPLFKDAFRIHAIECNFSPFKQQPSLS